MGEANGLHCSTLEHFLLVYKTFFSTHAAALYWLCVSKLCDLKLLAGPKLIALKHYHSNRFNQQVTKTFVRFRYVLLFIPQNSRTKKSLEGGMGKTHTADHKEGHGRVGCFPRFQQMGCCPCRQDHFGTQKSYT